jgi:hypothetical protein
MKTDKTGGRRGTVLPVSMPQDEALRLRLFAQSVGRPVSWVVRDALRLYLARLEADAQASAARLTADTLEPDTTPPPPVGRAGRPVGSRDREPRKRPVTGPMSD